MKNYEMTCRTPLLQSLARRNNDLLDENRLDENRVDFHPSQGRL